MSLNLIFERPDSRLGPLPRLHLRDGLLGGSAQAAQLIQLGVAAFPNHPAFVEIERRAFNQRLLQATVNVGQLIQLLPKFPQTTRLDARC